MNGGVAGQPIKVSSKLLGHISEGFYRSTAAAIKELVSNAFDADASTVEITTSRPSFDVFTCTDDGSGILYDEFVRLMDGNIGTSDKRAEEGLSDALRRPLIGRLGVGILAVGQFCHSFSLESHHEESHSAFKGTVRLSQGVLNELDQAEKSETYEVGTFDAEPIDFQPTRRGTRIFSHDLKTAFIQRMRDDEGETSEQDRGPIPRDFSRFYRQVVAARGLRELGEYRTLVWGLAHYCPVQYLATGPVRGRSTARIHKERLAEHDFKVVVDGCELRKPILLPSVKQAQPARAKLPKFDVFRFDIDEEVYGARLVVNGYVYAQGGMAIQPPEIRGIVLRVRDVAIGPYDRSLLDYPYVEGPRLEWISGELYASHGLEDALTATRDSFDVLHPHYRHIQRRLFELLRTKVFPRLWEGIEERTEAREAERRREFLQDVPDAIEKATGVRCKVRLRTAPNEPPVTVDSRRRLILVNEALPWRGGKARKNRLQKAFLAFEAARTLEKNPERSRDVFESLIRALL